MSLQSVYDNLNYEINGILLTNESLYNHLFEYYESYGILPQEYMTQEVISRLFIDEDITDAEIVQLFGVEKRKLQRIRSKWGVTMNNPRYTLRSLYRGTQSDFGGLKANIGEFEAYRMRKELEKYFDPENAQDIPSPYIQQLIETISK